MSFLQNITNAYQPNVRQVEHGRAVCRFPAHLLLEPAWIERAENLQCAAASLYQPHEEYFRQAMLVAWRNALVELYAPRDGLDPTARLLVGDLHVLARNFNSVVW